MKRRDALRVGFALVVALALGTPARTEVVLLQPGAEGEDSSPYSFIPSLPRGNRDTSYVFSLRDETGTHDFETFLRFELPADLLAPGEGVVEAVLWVYYGFDFSGFGTATDAVGEVECRPVLEPWDAETLTWVDKPAYGDVVDAQPDITSLGLIWCDVTSLVAQWVAGVRPNYGFALTNPTERLIGFYSFDATGVERNLRPSLVIETGVGGVVPPIPPESVPEPGAAAALVASCALLARWMRRSR
jgi:hypothetical protein